MTVVRAVVVVAVVALLGMASGAKIVNQFDQNVPFRLGGVRTSRRRGLRLTIPFVNNLSRVWPRIVSVPIQSRATSCATPWAWTPQWSGHFRMVDAMSAVVTTENRCCYRPDRSDQAHKGGWSTRSRQTLSETAGVDLDVSEILDRNPQRGVSK